MVIDKFIEHWLLLSKPFQLLDPSQLSGPSGSSTLLTTLCVSGNVDLP